MTTVGIIIFAIITLLLFGLSQALHNEVAEFSVCAMASAYAGSIAIGKANTILLISDFAFCACMLVNIIYILIKSKENKL